MKKLVNGRFLLGQIVCLLLLSFCACLATAAHQHTYAVFLREEPTCVDEGLVRYRCTGCFESYTETLPALGHDFSDLWTVDRQPTCSERGLKSRHCSRCSETTDLIYLNTTRHSFETTIIPPTCTEKGYTHRVCTVCGGASDTDFVPALGHTLPEHGEITKQPTCTQTGTETLRCAVCGWAVTRDAAALGHSFSQSWTIDKAPTCSAKGEQSHHCVRCDKRKDVTSIEKLSHQSALTAAVAPTCTQSGQTGGTHCSLCGKTLEAPQKVPALGHDMQTLEVLRQPDCTNAGLADAKCTRCGLRQTQEIAALGHSYAESWTVDKEPTCSAQGEQSHHCIRCGKRKDVTAIEKRAHQSEPVAAVPATCTEPGQSASAVCVLCGKTLEAPQKIPALGHDMQILEVLKQADCVNDGLADAKCSRCELRQNEPIPAFGHSFGEDPVVDKEPTCDAKGEQSYHCVRCGKRKNVTELPRLEHEIVYETQVAPTCTETGRASSSRCALCGKVLSGKTEIPATGHTPKTGLRAATTKKDGRRLVRCTVCKQTLSDEKISKIASVSLSAKRLVWNGERQIPEITVKDAAGKTIRQKGNYKLEFETNRKSIGRHTLIVRFAGSYAGTVRRAYLIVPRKPTALDYTSDAGSVSLCWKAVRGAAGYRIYLFNPKTGYATLLGKSKEPRYTFKKLLPGTQYVLFVRAFSNVGGETFLGPASAKKKTATKPAPVSLFAERSGGKTVLRWNDCGDCVYEIYAAERKNGKFTCIGTTKKQSFSLPSYASGTVRCFKVKALVNTPTATLSSRNSDILKLSF